MNAPAPITMTSADLMEVAQALGVIKRAAEGRAKRGAWPYQEIKANGGLKRYYPLASLPADVRQAVLAHRTHAALPVVAEVAVQAAAVTPAELTDGQILERDARSGVLAAIRRLQGVAQCSQEAAMTTLLIRARAGELDAHLDKLLRLARDKRGRQGDGYPSIRTLKRWLATHDLAPKIPRRDMAVPAWAKDFLTHYQQPQKPSVESAYRDFSATWPGVSIHQVRRFVGKLGTVTRERGRMGARELKNIQPFVRRDWSDFAPNDAWIADGHCYDAEVQHPLHGRPFRPEITVFIDGGTRRVTGWSLGLAENSYGVADALAYGVRHCGIPAIVYGDNGAGYRANLLTDEATGILARIHATPKFALPYNSQAKGIVERLHQTLWVASARELPSYVGAQMDRQARLAQFKLTRKALKNGGSMPLIPWDVFVTFITEKVAAYNARAHRSLGGISPDGAWANWQAKGWRADMLNEHELDVLFRPRVERIAQRGEINLFSNIYFARELEEFHGLAMHVAYDIHDATRIWVYTPEGRFVCHAEANGNRRAAFPVSVQQQAIERRAKGRLSRVDAKRDEILEELHGAPAIAAPSAAQIVIGGRVIDPTALQPVTPTQVPETARLGSDTFPHTTPDVGTQPATAVSRSDRTPAQNYADWCEIDRRIFEGDSVSDDDARWHQRYQQSAQYRAEAKRKAAA